MAELRILNSPNARIFTACDHCSFVMKTTADSLYYLVECPNCAKDFICTRYKAPKAIEKKAAQRKPVTSYQTEMISIQTARKYTRHIYEYTVIGLFAVNTFFIGLTNEYRVLIWSLVLLFFIYIIQFLVNLGLDIKERQIEILEKLGMNY